MSERVANLPPEQEAIRAKCFHPTGTFIEFKKEELEQSIPDRFEKIVARFPNHIAVKSKNQTLTYGQLNQAANGVGQAVLSYLGRSQEPVALLFENEARLIATVLGVLKAGKFYVPLDASYPHARNRSIEFTGEAHRNKFAESLLGKGFAPIWVSSARHRRD